MSDGQAESPETMDTLTEFIEDIPTEPSDDELEQTAEAPEGDKADAEKVDPDEAPEGEDAENQQGLKFKVPIKGEDGTDTTVEVDQKELIAGYQRHADYTRKTQELATRERDVTQQVVQKLHEGQQYYVEQAQMVREVIRHVAGLKTPQEMAQLSQTDPAQWVAEQQRERAIIGVMGQIEQSIQREQALKAEAEQASRQKAFASAWEVLGKEGIDKPKLQTIYEKAQSAYKISNDVLAGLYDPRYVLVLRDAIAYRELKAKTADATKKPIEAPKLPQARQTAPRNEQLAKQLSGKFSSGKAKLRDLAAYLENN